MDFAKTLVLQFVDLLGSTLPREMNCCCSGKTNCPLNLASVCPTRPDWLRSSPISTVLDHAGVHAGQSEEKSRSSLVSTISGLAGLYTPYPEEMSRLSVVPSTLGHEGGRTTRREVQFC